MRTWEKKSERISELLPSAGSTSGAEDITPRQFVLALYEPPPADRGK